MIDGFLIKKLVSIFIHLVPGVPILLLLSLLLRRWMPRFSFFFSVLCIFVLIAASAPVVSNYLVSRLENQHPVLQSLPADTKAVIVLGFGHSYAPQRPINSILNPVALSRLTEAVRLWKTNPTSTLIVSGAPQSTDEPSHAEMMEQMALELGVSPNRIIRFDNTYDTEDEIVSAVKLMAEEVADDERLVVVSSATHLPRAAMLLSQHSVVYSLAPAEFLVSDGIYHMPSAYVLLSTDRAVHEWVGVLWYRLRNFF